MSLKKKNISSLEGLVWQAIQIYPVDKLEQFIVDPDERVRLAAARRLQVHGGRFGYELAVKLIKSDDVDLKIIGIFILGQLGSPDFPFLKTSQPILMALLGEKSRRVQREAMISLGHLGVDSAVSRIVNFASSKDKKTRMAAAAALSRFENNEIAKSALLRLSHDESEEVRYWAE